jgi:hypothetical protein
MVTHIFLTSLMALVSFQTNSNSISGHVSNDQRAPLADVRVELLNEVDSVIRTVKTDGSGLFVFRKLSDGTFQVRVQTSGTNYISQTKRVDLARPHGFGAAFEELDFILTTAGNTRSAAKPGVVFVQEVPEPARISEGIGAAGEIEQTTGSVRDIEERHRYFPAVL